jgi:hypothetical protein
LNYGLSRRETNCVNSCGIVKHPARIIELDDRAANLGFTDEKVLRQSRESAVSRTSGERGFEPQKPVSQFNGLANRSGSLGTFAITCWQIFGLLSLSDASIITKIAFWAACEIGSVPVAASRSGAEFIGVMLGTDSTAPRRSWGGNLGVKSCIASRRPL